MDIPSQSAYIDGLEIHVKKRYLLKIACLNGVDPYTIKNKDCYMVKPDQQDTFKYLPPIAFSDIYCFLIEGISPYTKEQLKNYKSLTGYNQFVSGFVRDVMVKTFDEYVLVKGIVMHSQRLNEPPLKPWIVVHASSAAILSGHCNCMAGLDESCSHVAALLFYIEYAVRFRERTTVTGVKAYWSVPVMKEVDYVPIAEMNLDSAAARKRTLDDHLETVADVKNNSIQGNSTKKQSCILVQKVVPMITNEEHKKLADKLFSRGVKGSYFSIDKNYQADYIPKCINEGFPILLSELYDEKTKGLPLEDLVKHCQNVKIDFTIAQAQKVERESKLQTKTKTWNHFRAGRITASNFYRACHSNPDSPSASLISAICYPNAVRFENDATRWGITNEETMRMEYVKVMKEKHVNFKCDLAGLSLNPRYPYLGASPDGLVGCDCCGNGLLEIKCPYTLKNKSYMEGFTNKNFCLTEHSKINRQHQYYWQVQAQMFVSERQFVDFCVWTNIDFHIDRVFPDESFWELEYKKAEIFFKRAILPQLIGKYFTDDPAQKENEPKKKRGKKKVASVEPSVSSVQGILSSVGKDILSPSKNLNQVHTFPNNIVGKPQIRKSKMVNNQENNNGSPVSKDKLQGNNGIQDNEVAKDILSPSKKFHQNLVAQKKTDEKPKNRRKVVTNNQARNNNRPIDIDKTQDILEDKVDKLLSSNNESWCYCKGPESGQMIFCESGVCSFQWFHVKCLKLKKIPKGKWICPNCSDVIKNRRRLNF